PGPIFALQGTVLTTPDEAHATTRWHGAALRELPPDFHQRASALLGDAAGIDRLFLAHPDEPWASAAIDSAEDIQDARTLAQELHGNFLPAARTAATELATHCDAL